MIDVEQVPASASASAGEATASADTRSQVGSTGASAAAGRVKSDALRELRFHVDKSLRYHQRRRGHYERLHRWTMLGVIVAGSAAFAEQAPKVFGALAALLGAFDLVFGYSHRARDHDQLHRRFVELSIKARAATPGDEATIKTLIAERERLEADEPPIFWLLEADCDNETTVAWGLERKNGLVPLTRWQRFTMNMRRADGLHLPSRQTVQGV